jgi:hypothetical protein
MIGTLSLKSKDEKCPNPTPKKRVFHSSPVVLSFRLRVLVVPYYGTSSAYEGY